MRTLSELKQTVDWELVVRVSRFLSARGAHCYVVGGWVRDALLGRVTQDIDFSVSGDGLAAASALAGELNGTFVALDLENRVGRVVLRSAVDGRPSVSLDFASLAGNLGDDLRRRDFTIDALAVDPIGPDDTGPGVIDVVGGLSDLAESKIRATGDTVFRSDPVRLLRAVRLAAQLGFSIDPETEALIRRDAGQIAGVAGERVREELSLILSLPGSGKYLAYLDSLRLLTSLIPELEISRGFGQPAEHHWDVLRHCLETARAFDFLLREARWEYADPVLLDGIPWSGEIRDYFRAEVGYHTTREGLFRLACVLHDVAKPQTRSVQPDGRVRFIGHATQGSEIAVQVMQRLRFSLRETRLVETAVKYHLRPTQMGWPDLPTRRAVYRFCRDGAEAVIGILFLSLADHLATRGPNLTGKDWATHARITSEIMTRRLELPSPKEWLIDGYDIMNVFGLTPGPRVGELIELAHEAQVSGQVVTKDQALEFLRSAVRRDEEAQERGGT